MGLFTKTSGEGWSLDTSSGRLTISGDLGNALYPFEKIAKKVHSVVALKGARVSKGSNLFSDMKNLAEADLSELDTSACESFKYMFYGCRSLTSLDLSTWDTANVKSMGNMFFRCSSLVSLDLSKWNLQSTEDMGEMFEFCENLKDIKTGTGWAARKLINAKSMFSFCHDLRSLKLGGWDVSKVTNMSDLFYDCKSLELIDLTGWRLNKETKTKSMFRYVPKTVRVYTDDEAIIQLLPAGAEPLTPVSAAPQLQPKTEPAPAPAKKAKSKPKAEPKAEPKAAVRETVTDYVYEDYTYTGEIENGVPNGTGRCVFKSGNTYEGMLKAGKRNGKGIFRWASGNRYEGEFTENIRNGKGVYRWTNGDVYEGGFTDGKPTGKGIYTWADGTIYEGDFRDGNHTGKGVLRSSSGSIIHEGYFVDGKYVGQTPPESKPACHEEDQPETSAAKTRKVKQEGSPAETKAKREGSPAVTKAKKEDSQAGSIIKRITPYGTTEFVFKCKIMDELGIHARPAGSLVKEAKQFTSKITLIKDDKSATASKMLAVMNLGVKCGDIIEVLAEGADAEAAAEAMKNSLIKNFDAIIL